MKALYNISYGVYILTAKAEKHNGCVINTLMQITSSPTKISITVNKDNYTTKMIQRTGEFNVSILDESTKFDIIQRFGFSSGSDTDKFEGYNDYKIAKNGISYVTKCANSYLSAKVVSMFDVGTHITFIAEVTEDVMISDRTPITYAYYLSNIKPKPAVLKNRVHICRICGYVYEGEVLPEDFICPICAHGAIDFEVQESEVNNAKLDVGTIIPNSAKAKKYYCPICGNLESNVNAKICAICGTKMVEVEI